MNPTQRAWTNRGLLLSAIVVMVSVPIIVIRQHSRISETQTTSDAEVIDASLSALETQFTAEKQPITLQELRSRYMIIGALGKPLGSRSTIVARVVENQGKGPSEYLEIHESSGVTASRALRLPFRDDALTAEESRRLRDGRTHPLQVEETVRLEGSPDDYRVQSSGYGLSSIIRIVSLDDQAFSAPVD